ncbi:MAG: hypothetical protein HN742_05680 [Lentisphaerae bacterium]|jgi:hypothetical protein|nr:hypothetical protein [Lentisphaerota bacterium]MBT4815218.1 hypothetical protein [Lentisphaerota bacterium]MBT5606910.1 hypothetical protein [Lentisphaerota bacterium]MBT7059794.1 hypothetical protein [Lentisphaerota bacterium]MBT7841340.1 hypothetical protein [Lentisphaerota bacterium]
MWTGVLSVVAVCVVLMVVLACVRKKPVLNTSMPPGAALGVIAGAVVVAGAMLYWLVVCPPGRPPLDEGVTESGEGMGGMGMGGGGGGGWGQPSPARDLSQLVRKMAELQKQNTDTFPESQQAALLPMLRELRDQEKLPEEKAVAADAAIQALLAEEQKEALGAVELPRRRRGGGGRGPGGPGGRAGKETAGGPQPPSQEPTPSPTAEASSSPDTPAQQSEATQPARAPEGMGRRAAFRERLLQIPAVKEAYDTRASEDPAFAEDTEAQRDFFRSIMREISPFQRGSTKEAVELLIAAFGGENPGATPDTASPSQPVPGAAPATAETD